MFRQVAGSESNECVFSRGTPTHARQSLSLALPCPAPSPCSIIVYEDETLTQTPAENAVLAQVDVTTFLESSKFVKMDFHLKSDGSLHVTLQEPKSKVNQSFIIEADRS
ncbi:heat shock protein [Penaeus vannamei]|uniref:Heat shock protein n=1 Tax=Penaeus vannamei TaxID=6689 RepID=A0A423T975_PENVA|nr:heat shock protein [Penaeus vannamei]